MHLNICILVRNMMCNLFCIRSNASRGKYGVQYDMKNPAIFYAGSRQIKFTYITIWNCGDLHVPIEMHYPLVLDPCNMYPEYGHV